ncbi:MAG: DinB family protein, partial [Gammaproteobacteria bacterium]
MTAEHFRFLARYNTWINEQLYAACANAPDRERKADRGAFFGSLHGTLNHLLLADRVWMGRFEDEPYAAPGLDAELYSDFAPLRAARIAEDARIVRWAEQLDDHTLAGTLRYTSLVNPAPRAYVYWQVATHFFNHQTHHRGQASGLLTQMGIDYGVT